MPAIRVIGNRGYPRTVFDRDSFAITDEVDVDIFAICIYVCICIYAFRKKTFFIYLLYTIHPSKSVENIE